MCRCYCDDVNLGSCGMVFEWTDFHCFDCCEDKQNWGEA